MEKQKQQLWELLHHYSNIFAFTEEDKNGLSSTQDQYWWCSSNLAPPSRLPQAKKEAAEQKIKKMIDRKSVV